jgi:hypothetical protein
LSFSDGGATYSPKTGSVSGWTQSIDLHTGVITTSARWTAPDHHVTQIAYRVFTDRGREHVGVVQLVLTPQWSGTATVSDELDGTADRITGAKLPPVLTTQGAKSWDLANRREGETVQAMGPASPPPWPISLCRAPTSPRPAPPSIRASTRAWASGSRSR